MSLPAASSRRCLMASGFVVFLWSTVPISNCHCAFVEPLLMFDVT